MIWHPWITLDRRIRAVLAERLDRGASDKLDRLLAVFVAERDVVARAEWSRDSR